MARTIRNNTAESRWEIVEDDVLAGFAEYEDTGELVVFTHTEILPGNEGKGIAGASLCRSVRSSRHGLISTSIIRIWTTGNSRADLPRERFG